MGWIEAAGKTLEEARAAAASELGVPADQIEVEVLEEGARGFLGIAQPKVRIRARALAEESEETPAAVQEEEIGEQAAVPSETGISKAQRALRMLEDVLQAMRLEAQPRLVSETDEEVQIEIVGAPDDIGRIIGHHGQTLDALQYLAAIAVNRHEPGRVRILLDAEGYRDRHRQMLEAKAHEYARKVKETGSEAVLEPQSARDRRIVHMALADDPDVYTYSEGEGEDRHVVISPRK